MSYYRGWKIDFINGVYQAQKGSVTFFATGRVQIERLVDAYIDLQGATDGP